MTPDQAYVRALMAETGLHQTALAKAAGLTPDILSKLFGSSKTGRLRAENLDKLRSYAASIASSVSYDPKSISPLHGVDVPTESEDALTEAALIGLWRRLEHADDRALALDIIDAAVRSNMRRRRGA